MPAVPANGPQGEGRCGLVTRPRMAPRGVGESWLPMVPLRLLSSGTCGHMGPLARPRVPRQRRDEPAGLWRSEMRRVCWGPVPADGKASVGGPCSHGGDGNPARGAGGLGPGPGSGPEPREPGARVGAAEEPESGATGPRRRGVRGERRRRGRCAGAAGRRGRGRVDASEARERAELSGARRAGFAWQRLRREARGCVERSERGRPWPWISRVFGFVERSGVPPVSRVTTETGTAGPLYSVPRDVKQCFPVRV